MPDHIYSAEVNKISPVSSKTELLQILPVFVLLKGLTGSGRENYIGGAGEGGGGVAGAWNGKLFGKELLAQGRLARYV